MTYQQTVIQAKTRWVSGPYDALIDDIREAFRDRIRLPAITDAVKTGHGICRGSVSAFGEQILDAVALPVPIWTRGSDHWWDHEPSLVFGLALWCKAPSAISEWLRGDVLPKQVAMLGKTYPNSSVALIGEWDFAALGVLQNHGFLAAEPVDELFRSWHDKMKQFMPNEVWCMKKP